MCSAWPIVLLSGVLVEHLADGWIEPEEREGDGREQDAREPQETDDANAYRGGQDGQDRHPAPGAGRAFGEGRVTKARAGPSARRGMARSAVPANGPDTWLVWTLTRWSEAEVWRMMGL
jgi:hypothetical protein